VSHSSGFCCSGSRLRHFFHRQRFAGQRGLGDEQIARLHDAQVRRDHIPRRQLDDVARHQLVDRQLQPAAFPCSFTTRSTVAVLLTIAFSASAALVGALPE
jgi:hypothetical protein